MTDSVVIQEESSLLVSEQQQPNQVVVVTSDEQVSTVSVSEEAERVVVTTERSPDLLVVTNGGSAYITAVDEGFVGTEAEWISGILDNKASVSWVVGALTDQEQAFSMRLDQLETQFGDTYASITMLNEALSTEQLARATQITNLETSIANNYATQTLLNEAVSTESLARSTAITNLETSINGEINAQINTVNEAISTEQSARATADQTLQASIDGVASATITRLDQVEVDVDGNASAISGIRTAVAGSDSQSQAELVLQSTVSKADKAHSRAFLGVGGTSGGKYAITGLTLDSATRGIYFQGDVFELRKSNGSLALRYADNTWKFGGDLEAAGGIFSGDLQAAGGTFSGNLSAVGGTFSGDLSAVGGTFTGDISAASGTFSGSVYAQNIIGESAAGAVKTYGVGGVAGNPMEVIDFTISKQSFSQEALLDPFEYVVTANIAGTYTAYERVYINGSLHSSFSRSFTIEDGGDFGPNSSVTLSFRRVPIICPANTNSRVIVRVDFNNSSCFGSSSLTSLAVFVFKNNNVISFN